MLSSKRCTYREWKLSDYDDLKEIFSNDKVCEYLPINGHLTDEQIKKVLDRHIAMAPSNKQESSLYAIKYEGKVIGYCGVVFIKEKDKFEIMYGLNEDYWGQGFASEAAFIMKEVAKEKGLKEVIAFADPKNIPSNLILKKIGYQFIDEIDLWNMRLSYYEMSL